MSHAGCPVRAITASSLSPTSAPSSPDLAIFEVVGISQVAGGCLGLLEQFLTEGVQYLGGVSVVKGYEPGQVGGMIAAYSRQVGVYIVLELMRERGELWFVDLVGLRELDRVHQLCSRATKARDRPLEHGSRLGVRALRPFSPDAKPGALERSRLEKGGVIARLSRRTGRGRIVTVRPGEGG